MMAKPAAATGKAPPRPPAGPFGRRAIAAQQASLHGGEIKVADSSLGGARFEVWLTATDRTNPVTSSALHEPSVETPIC